MVSAVESIGQLHENYSDFATSQGAPSSFEDCLIWNLIDLENANYNPLPHAVTADNGDVTLTMGYGLDIDRYGDWSEVRQLLVYGYGGEGSLSQLQIQGLELLRQYKENESTWSAEDMVDMAQGQASPSGEWTQQQAAAVASLSLNSGQAELILRAITFGAPGAGVTEQESIVGSVRRIIRNNYNIDGDFPESTELVSIVIMRFRGDFTGFNSAFNSPEYSAGAERRAEFWWRIVNKIEAIADNQTGVKHRLELNAKMFGAFPEGSNPMTDDSVLEGLSFLFKEHLSAGLSASADPFIRRIFEETLAVGITQLKSKYAPDGGEFDVVRFAKDGGDVSILEAAVNFGKLKHLLVGNDDENTLRGGSDQDFLWGRSGNDHLHGEGGDDYLYGEIGDDVIYGGAGADTIKGGMDDDELHGEAGENVLYGEAGNDTLVGGAEFDYLDGGANADTLRGGAGRDIYIVDSSDVVEDDSLGMGAVILGNKLLTGGKRKESDPENEYKGGGNTYVLTGATLVVNGGLTINNYKKGDLGIILETEPDDPNDPPPPPDGGPSTGGAETKRSPIVIDLDGDGVETLPIGDKFFDLDADGLSESTGWVNSDDGLLVHDRDGNGRISNGTELFGNHSLLANGDTAQNGFQALAEYDNNGDGLVNAQDASYASLQVWRDLNGNGVSDEGELQSLADAGVLSISTGYTNSSHVDAHGHEHRQVATVMLSNGTASTAADVWFKVDSGKRVNSGDIELTPDVVFLANAKGYGKVHDLHQAMVLDPELKNLLNQYVSAADGPARDALLDNLIYRWAGAADVDPYSRDPKKVYGHVMDARQLVTLENLVGRPYMGIWCWGEYDPNPHGQAAPILVAEYLEFKRFTAAQILAQTEYASELDIIKSAFGSDAHSITVDWDALQGKLDTLLSNEQVDSIRGVITVLTDLGTYSPRYSAERDAAFQAIVASRVDLAPFFDFSTRIGTAGADTLYGVNTGTIFYGAAGDDRLYGYTGGDSYHFARGHGNDTILDRGGLDQVVFGAGISQTDLTFSRNATTVWIHVKNADGSNAGSVRIDNFFDFDGSLDFGAIELLRFADGSSLNQQQVLDILVATSVTANDDLVFGTTSGDVIDALGKF